MSKKVRDRGYCSPTHRRNVNSSVSFDLTTEDIERFKRLGDGDKNAGLSKALGHLGDYITSDHPLYKRSVSFRMSYEDWTTLNKAMKELKATKTKIITWAAKQAEQTRSNTTN